VILLSIATLVMLTGCEEKQMAPEGIDETEQTIVKSNINE
jgi:hypothetical protein